MPSKVNIKADLLDRGKSANAEHFVYGNKSAISSQEAILFVVVVMNFFRDNQSKIRSNGKLFMILIMFCSVLHDTKYIKTGCELLYFDNIDPRHSRLGWL